MNLFGNMAAGIREINRKYAKPEIELTWTVKVCLLSLRVYLLAMVVLMVIALWQQARSSNNPAPESGTNATTTITQPVTTTDRPVQVP